MDRRHGEGAHGGERLDGARAVEQQIAREHGGVVRLRGEIGQDRLEGGGVAVHIGEDGDGVGGGHGWLLWLVGVGPDPQADTPPPFWGTLRR